MSQSNLRDDLCEQLRRYLAGQQPLLAVREWLEAHVEEVSDADDETLHELDGDVWALLSELDARERTEDDLRAILSERHPDLRGMAVS